MFVKLAVKTNERREKVGKNVIFALHIKTYIYTVKHKLQGMVSPLPGMTCLKRNQYIGQNLGFDSLNDNGCAGGHFVYYRLLPRAFIKALSRGIFK